MTMELPEKSLPHKVYEGLRNFYGPQGWWPILQRAGEMGFDAEGYHPGLEFSPDPPEQFEIATGAVLTQNTGWNNVRMSLHCLLDFLRSNELAFLPDSIKYIELPVLADLISSSGYYNQKARKLKILAEFFSSPRGIPEREDLLSLWGIGPETADSILLYGYGRAFFVVDAYTVRIFSRLSGHFMKSPHWYEVLQDYFQENLEPLTELYAEFHALLVRLGKDYCSSRSPNCGECPLKYICNTVEKSKIVS